MSTTLALTALLMGLAGGPHCIAMCGAACGAIVRAREPQPVHFVAEVRRAPQLQFQLGRLVGYSVAGALAGAAMQGFAWLSSSTASLRLVWTVFHLGILAWGLMLLVLARQPAWVDAAGRSVWARVRPIAQARGGLLATGALWAFMPCGLLYSALLVASLSGGPLEGALSMALFAVASGIWLGLAPAALRWLQSFGNRIREGGGTRIAGGLLAAAAAWALWMDLAERIGIWCAT